MIEITPDLAQLRSLLTALDTLAGDEWIADALREITTEVGQATAAHYLASVAILPYSPSYLGRLKPSGAVIAGGAGDRGHSIDTATLYNDLAENWEVDRADGAALIGYSDQFYAAYQEAIVNDKGASLFADDDLYLDAVEGAIGREIDTILRLV